MSIPGCSIPTNIPELFFQISDTASASIKRDGSSLTSFLVAAGLFVINSKLDGWGHCLFHVLLVPYMAFLCRSAAAADTGSGECDIAS